MSKHVPPKKIKAVLFDLGKVILHFNFEPAFRRLSKASGMSPKDIEDYFVQAGLEVLYDGGKITSLTFHRQIKKATKHSMTFAQFKKTWNDIFTPNKAIVKLIGDLKRSGYRLVLISNTNAMHFEHIRKKYPVMKHFDKLILSYKEKIRKPDERIYRTAARACRAKPCEIFYIDDRADLTDAARELGFNVFTYKNNPEDLLRSMSRAGVA